MKRHPAPCINPRSISGVCGAPLVRCAASSRSGAQGPILGSQPGCVGTTIWTQAPKVAVIGFSSSTPADPETYNLCNAAFGVSTGRTASVTSYSATGAAGKSDSKVQHRCLCAVPRTGWSLICRQHQGRGFAARSPGLRQTRIGLCTKGTVRGAIRPMCSRAALQGTLHSSGAILCSNIPSRKNCDPRGVDLRPNALKTCNNIPSGSAQLLRRKALWGNRFARQTLAPDVLHQHSKAQVRPNSGRNTKVHMMGLGPG